MKLARTPIKPPDGGMLTHFTRASHPAAALDNLAAILGAGMIRASIRMIKDQTAGHLLLRCSLRVPGPGA